MRDWRRWLRSVTMVYEKRRDARIADEVVEMALAFRDTGMPIDEAFGWAVRGITAADAVHHRNHGWNPHTFSTLASLCEASPSTQSEWVEAPLPAQRAMRYARAGLSITEALGHERRRLAGDDVDSGLDLLIGFRGEAES